MEAEGSVNFNPQANAIQTAGRAALTLGKAVEEALASVCEARTTLEHSIVKGARRPANTS